MNILLKKITLFLLPFIFAFLLFTFCYTESVGDLSRLSKISYPDSYRTQFKTEVDEPQLWKNFSDLDVVSSNLFDLSGMGDHIKDLLGNKAKAEQMGEKGKKHIKDDFTIDRYITTLGVVIKGFKLK